eukprot:TRINITY_DN2556_c0_g1_i1.p1 TRINITY_DN2556_c0_g1~~TRINITY_DN2556_c0_g1_i1.p1  ORF type:complete len:340 (-),score=86.29 TRINITY_DN2556_c0_g1_i1:22-888(-)
MNLIASFIEKKVDQLGSDLSVHLLKLVSAATNQVNYTDFEEGSGSTCFLCGFDQNDSYLWDWDAQEKSTAPNNLIVEFFAPESLSSFVYEFRGNKFAVAQATRALKFLGETYTQMNSSSNTSYDEWLVSFTETLKSSFPHCIILPFFTLTEQGEFLIEQYMVSLVVENKPKCTYCGTARNKLAACSRCHEAFYCNATCQRSHYPQHKTACLKRAKEIQEERIRKLENTNIPLILESTTEPANEDLVREKYRKADGEIIEAMFLLENAHNISDLEKNVLSQLEKQYKPT